MTRAALVVLGALALLSGCAVPVSPAGPEVKAELAACPAPQPDRGGSLTPPAPAGGRPGDDQVRDVLAGLELACLGGGAPVALARLGRPAVINLWASWCAPCRVELPELSRFARDAGSQLVVLGVVSGDTAAAASAAVADFGVGFANVFDPQRTLLRALGRVGLPVTLLVDGYGRVAYVHQGAAPLDHARLVELTRAHLGVELS